MSWNFEMANHRWRWGWQRHCQAVDSCSLCNKRGKLSKLLYLCQPQEAWKCQKNPWRGFWKLLEMSSNPSNLSPLTLVQVQQKEQRGSPLIFTQNSILLKKLFMLLSPETKNVQDMLGQAMPLWLVWELCIWLIDGSSQDTCTVLCWKQNWVTLCDAAASWVSNCFITLASPPGREQTSDSSMT